MNETPVVTSIIPCKERLQYQYNPATKQLMVKTASVDNDVKLYNLQGVCLKYITPNTNTVLSNLPTGIYIIASKGIQPEKIIVY